VSYLNLHSRFDIIQEYLHQSINVMKNNVDTSQMMLDLLSIFITNIMPYRIDSSVSQSNYYKKSLLKQKIIKIYLDSQLTYYQIRLIKLYFI